MPQCNPASEQEPATHRFNLGKRNCVCGAEEVATPLLRKYPRSEGMGLSGRHAAKKWGEYLGARDRRQTFTP
jgi:hypothetical protein